MESGHPGFADYSARQDKRRLWFAVLHRSLRAGTKRDEIENYSATVQTGALSMVVMYLSVLSHVCMFFMHLCIGECVIRP